MTDRDLMFEIIRYLEYRNKTVSDGYEWRKVNGLILQIKHNFEISDEEHNQIYYQVNQFPRIEENQTIESMLDEIWK